MFTTDYAGRLNMAAGTCTVLGPYKIGDTTTIGTALTNEGGAIVKSITAYQDAGNQRVYFVVCTEA